MTVKANASRGRARDAPAPKVDEEESVEDILAAVAAPVEPEPQPAWDIFVDALERSETRLKLERPAEVVRMTNGDLGVRFLAQGDPPVVREAPPAPPQPTSPPFDLGRFEEMLHQELSDRGIQLNRGAFATIVQRALARKPVPPE